MSAAEDRELGMHRRIPRRDFLNGIAMGITGAVPEYGAGVRCRSAVPECGAGVRCRSAVPECSRIAIFS